MAYEKHNWVNGEVIDADKLNHIEEGIAETIQLTEQTLTDEQKLNARTNIGAITASEAPVQSVNGQTGAVTIPTATTSANGLMSSTDKSRLDDLYADYSSAMTALGV